MSHKKTSLICSECGNYIYSDEGFTTKGTKHYHAKSCDNILRPHQVKKYKPPENLELDI